MDAQVPAVVAVVVTTDPGPWFDEALASLADQDYQELSVLVLATGEEEGIAERVARVLPEAFVRHLPGRPGYAAAANEALGMVEGAAFFLLLHDDVALDGNFAIHNLVEESFRSNAGVVSPKFVQWDNPGILLHVGMSCDKTGAVVDRIEEGEVDHGQHDAVRDVFVAPGGCILVRADLWRELGGFDPGILAMGEDLDLSWRCQVAGSRIVVAPEARVRHREVVAAGIRPIAVVYDEESLRHPGSLQALQRRHELRAVLKCYSTFHLIRVLPQAALLAAGEVVVALLARDRARARSVAHAWRWNWRHRAELRGLRRQIREHRLFPDAEVRRLQLRGSARLSQYFARLSHQGLDAANRVVGPRGNGRQADDSEVAVLTGSVGLAFSEDSDFDDLDDLGRRSGRDRFGRRVRRAPLSTGRQRVVAITVAALVLLVGTRELFFGSLPLLGQLAPLPSWSTAWHDLVSGWHASGVGTTAPATPALGFVGLLGTALFGTMGTTQHLLLLACLPVGAIGMSRLMRPLVSDRARVVAAIAYLLIPLPYADLGSGRLDGLVAFAVFPTLASLLARAAGISPFDSGSGHGWRSTSLGRVALLGGALAIAMSFAPAVLPLLLGCAVAWEVAALVVGSRQPTGDVLLAALKGAAVAVVLCAPWVVGSALAGSHALDIFGLPISAATAPSWGDLLRFAIGPAARSPLVWLLVLGAALPLLLGTGERLAWAARLWLMACLSWAGAMASSHGWMGSFTPSESVMLAPAALAVAACVGLGISAFENDLVGRSFGWRQVVSTAALVAVALGALPVIAAAGGGRWDMPTAGVDQPLAFLTRTSPAVGRVLWLGDPRALPVGGWSIEPGLAYGLTTMALPDASGVWTAAGPGPADTVADAVRQAIAGGTVHLGRLLAAAGVRDIVVVDGIAPSEANLAGSIDAPAPSGLTRALLDQNDLQAVPGESGVSVFENAQFVPVTAERASPALNSSRELSTPGVSDVEGWLPVLTPLAARTGKGTLSAGVVFAGYAPAGAFALSVDGHAVAERPAFGWAAQYPATPAGPATLSYDGAPLVPLLVLLEVLGWCALAVALTGWQGWPFRRRTVVVVVEDEE